MLLQIGIDVGVVFHQFLIEYFLAFPCHQGFGLNHFHDVLQFLKSGLSWILHIGEEFFPGNITGVGGRFCGRGFVQHPIPDMIFGKEDVFGLQTMVNNISRYINTLTIEKSTFFLF